MTSVAFQDSQLENVSVTFDKSLLQRSSPSAGIYIFNTPYNISVTKYRVDSVIIPGTQYHVDDTNNKIVVSATGNPKFTAAIEKGFYASEAKLLNAVDATLTAASLAATGPDHTYTVEAVTGTNVTNGTIKITQASGEITIHGGESTASHLLGLGDSDITSSSSILTCPDLVHLRGADALYVISPTLTSNKSYAGKKNGSIATIPLGEPNSVSTVTSENAAFVDLESSQSLRQFEINLRGSNGLPIQLQGQPPVIKMTFAVSRRPIF